VQKNAQHYFHKCTNQKCQKTYSLIVVLLNKVFNKNEKKNLFFSGFLLSAVNGDSTPQSLQFSFGSK